MKKNIYIHACNSVVASAGLRIQHNLFNKFYASVVLLIMNVKVAVDPRGEGRVDPQTTLTMLWRNSLSITEQTH